MTIQIMSIQITTILILLMLMTMITMLPRMQECFMLKMINTIDKVQNLECNQLTILVSDGF